MNYNDDKQKAAIILTKVTESNLLASLFIGIIQATNYELAC